MKRLRENTTLETEIQKTGEVVVEGHVIGRLDGFSFAPENSTGGSDAKALHAAARSALAGEIDARATRVSQAPEREFVLASDGTLRWSGAAVAKLAPGDDVMRPRLRLIADEQLTGAPREAVQARLDLWLKTHIERIFAPLFALAAAEDITGISRGIAYQLIEAIGVLERQRVAEEVKGLDQPSRATLRKYGVRFGAYHLYLPGLLKPAPRSLAAQLWALKHEAPDVKGLDDLQRLASSGRTSIPVDKETPKPLYRTVGYRVCGERAIRVDILERLADLIRPALSWRAGATSAKPPGAFDGSGFTVTGAMTSLTGASGEDFASILRSLGYRMDRRPKPAEPANVETPAEPANVETPAEPANVDTPPEAEKPPETVAPAEPTASPALTPDSEPVAAVAEPAADEAIPASPEATPAVLPENSFAAGEAVEQPSENVEKAREEAPQARAEATTFAIEAAPAEPAMVEVWRPGRPSGQRNRREAGQRRRKPSERHAPAPQGAADAPAAAEGQAVAGESAPAAAPDGERKERHGRPRHRREQPREERKEGDQPRPPRRAGKPERDDRGRSERPRGDRPDRPPRRDRDDNRPSRTWTSANERRGKEADPNSPFAKLLALKEQLEANKERQ
jgi:ATP-dependent RNA helicase SUPV3L1/SUV3